MWKEVEKKKILLHVGMKIEEWREVKNGEAVRHLLK